MSSRLLRTLAVLLVLVALTFAYGYNSGQVDLLSVDTHTKIEVNGAPVPGEMLVGRTTAIVTTREADKYHSYHLFFAGDVDSTGDMGFVVDCGVWVAPHLPVLPETRTYPPCRKVLHDLSDAGWRLMYKGSGMQFTSQDHAIVAIKRSAY